MIRSRAAIGAVVVVTAAVGLVATHASAQQAAPSVMIRGESADRESFSLSNVHSTADEVWLSGVHSRLFDACMKEKGFAAPPESVEGTSSGYSTQYGEAATGDDGTSSESPTRYLVKLPGGGTIEVHTTLTPDSCAYQIFSQLGSDPIYREGLRKRMMILEHQADSLAASQLEDLTAEWIKCTGLTNANASDLFRALDGDAVQPGAYRTDADCLPEDVAREVLEVRASHNLEVAADNQPLLAAWVALIDDELSKARSLAP